MFLFFFSSSPFSSVCFPIHVVWFGLIAFDTLFALGRSLFLRTNSYVYTADVHEYDYMWIRNGITSIVSLIKNMLNSFFVLKFQIILFTDVDCCFTVLVRVANKLNVNSTHSKLNQCGVGVGVDGGVWIRACVPARMWFGVVVWLQSNGE